MRWPDADTEIFPDPRGDEPARLRQDILDELNDHLALACARERAACGDEEQVWRRVLERFGDPNALARQLWWNAMREGIMREWIKAGTIVVVGLAMLAFMALLMVQMQHTNRQILTALESRPDAAGGTITSLNVYLHRGTPEGPPAEGIEAEFRGKLFGTEEIGVKDVTGPDGKLHFGPLEQGEYRLTLTDPVSGLSHSRDLVIWAGHGEEDRHIAAPDVGRKKVRLDAGLPAFNDDDYQRVFVELDSVWNYGDTDWRENRKLLVGAGGKVWSAVGSRQIGRLPVVFGEGKTFGSAWRSVGDSLVEWLGAADVPCLMRRLGIAYDSMSGSERPTSSRLATQTYYVNRDLLPATDESWSDGVPLPFGPNTMDGEVIHLPVSLQLRQEMERQARAWRNGKVLGDTTTNLPLALAEFTDWVPVGSTLATHAGWGEAASEPVLEGASDGSDFSVLSTLSRSGEPAESYCLIYVNHLVPPNDGASRHVLALSVIRAEAESNTNELLAFAVRSPWPDAFPSPVKIDPEPVARFAPEEVRDTQTLLVEIPREGLSGENGPPIHGVLIRWKEPGSPAKCRIDFRGFNDDKRAPRIVTLRTPEEAVESEEVTVSGDE